MSDDGRRRADETGGASPTGRSAKEQHIVGTRSEPQEGREPPRTEKQPPQPSNRRSAAHEQDPKVRKGYEDAQDPEKQGDGDPGLADE